MLPSVIRASTYGQDAYGGGTFGGAPPSVTTGAASSIGQTSAVLNGTIDSIGTTSPTVRGFAYGASASYGATTTESAASFSTGSYSVTVSAFSCNSSYHFMAYASSTNGIGYGSDATFTTSACPVGNGAVSGPLAPGFVQVVPMLTSTTAAPSTSFATSSSIVATSSVFSAPNIPQSAFAFSRDLKRGTVGNDVRELQKFLNARGFPVVPSGPGSPGRETTFFGPATQSALAKFQKVHGIIPSVGYFGPKTRAFFKTF